MKRGEQKRGRPSRIWPCPHKRWEVRLRELLLHIAARSPYRYNGTRNRPGRYRWADDQGRAIREGFLIVTRRSGTVKLLQLTADGHGVIAVGIRKPAEPYAKRREGLEQFRRANGIGGRHD